VLEWNAATSSRGGVAAWPLAAQAAMPVIGFLYPGSPEASSNLVAVFRKGLSEFAEAPCGPYAL
jgi:hypothetical protein